MGLSVSPRGFFLKTGENVSFHLFLCGDRIRILDLLSQTIWRAGYMRNAELGIKERSPRQLPLLYNQRHCWQISTRDDATSPNTPDEKVDGVRSFPLVMEMSTC